MWAKRIITIAVIMFLCLWGAMYLEADMQKYFFLELLIITAMALLAFAVVFAVSKKYSWSWNAALIFFAIAILNNLWLYYSVDKFVSSSVLMMANLLGFFISFSRSGNSDEPGLATYDAPKESNYKDEIVVERPVRDTTMLDIYDVNPEFYESKPVKKKISRKSAKKKPDKKKSKKKK